MHANSMMMLMMMMMMKKSHVFPLTPPEQSEHHQGPVLRPRVRAQEEDHQPKQPRLSE